MLQHVGPRRDRCLLRCHAFGRLFDQRGDRGGLGHIDGVAAFDLRHRRPRPFGHEALGTAPLTEVSLVRNCGKGPRSHLNQMLRAVRLMACALETNCWRARSPTLRLLGTKRLGRPSTIVVSVKMRRRESASRTVPGLISIRPRPRSATDGPRKGAVA
jgi:hypothetical protein